MPVAPTTVFASLGTTVFEVMSRLAEAHQAINLGQGFPDEPGPKSVIDRAAEYLHTGNNQYPPMAGLLALREAIARHELSYWGLARDPAGEVTVTSGATEALAACLLALVSPGDEVIVFEPLYDSYVPMIRRAGGVPVPVRLHAPTFDLDVDALRRALSPRTRAMLINNPANPAAKVFSPSELSAVAGLAREADLVVISDDVYEHLVFDDVAHVPIATLPDARDRTLKIGSAGKIFSMTGWKVGWITGPRELVSVVSRAHQYLTFSTPPNLQAGVAWGLDHERSFIAAQTRTLQAKRDHFTAGLRAAGHAVLPARGTYFVNIDLSLGEWAGRDAEYCRTLTERSRVAAIPLSAFYVADAPASTARFCFAKRYDVLDAALARLGAA